MFFFLVNPTMGKNPYSVTQKQSPVKEIKKKERKKKAIKLKATQLWELGRKLCRSSLDESGTYVNPNCDD